MREGRDSNPLFGEAARELEGRSSAAEPPANPSALKCPTCKRPLEEVQVSELREYFEPAADCVHAWVEIAGKELCQYCGAENRPAERE